MPSTSLEPQKTIITLYGYGYVGKAVYRFLYKHYDVIVIDPAEKIADPSLSEDEQKTLDANYFQTAQKKSSSHAIICVPTPMSEDGSADTSVIEDILKNTKHDFYLIKSTVPPGTTERLAKESKKQIAFSPEYIGEGKYEVPFWEGYPHPTDMKLHNFHIFGGEKKVTTEWVHIWQKVAGWAANYQQTNSRTAEMAKYATNMFLATKKIFCDELYEICGATGIDYTELRELWLLDGRIGPAMTLIFPQARGYGGKCLPKDTNALVANAKQHGYNADFFQAVIAANKRFRQD